MADIGPMANLAEMRPVGWNAATHALTAAGSIGAEMAYLHLKKQRQAGKDYNDQPVAKTVGAEGPNAVKEAPTEEPFA